MLLSFLQIRNAVILFSAKGPTFLDKTVCAYIYSVQLSVFVSLNLRAHSVDARAKHGGNTSNGIKGARVSREHGNSSNRVRGRLNAITSATDCPCYVFSTFLFFTVV